MQKKSMMERFKYYGELEKIVEGHGSLELNEKKSLKVSFEIARRGEEKLLFNAICETEYYFSSVEIFNFSGRMDLFGVDANGREVKANGLLIKDTEENTEGHTIINGYVGSCEIGEKKIEKNSKIEFHLLNFLFEGNETKVVKTNEKEILSRSALKLKFEDFECTIDRVNNYKVIKQLLKRQGGVIKTSKLTVDINSNINFNNTLEKVRKLCQLLSVARSTFINWGTCKIVDSNESVFYELHGQAQTRLFHGNSLINDFPSDTVNFLESAWSSYDEYEDVLDLRRFLYGYLDTYVNSYIETRCLNIAALVDSVSSRWAIQEEKNIFVDEKLFNDNLSNLSEGFKKVIERVFSNLKENHINAMANTASFINDRPMDWKLQRFRKSFKCPIRDQEINRFVKLRNSLAHSTVFPNEVDNTQAFLFMRHFLDRIVLRILNYEGKYFDMEKRKECQL